MKTRLLAAQIIEATLQGHSLSDTLEPALKQLKEARDRAFVQALCYGVCRYYARLTAVLSCLLEKPMKAKDQDVNALLLLGLYQLMEMNVPAHAAIAETVNASRKLKKTWAPSLVNAVLRNYQRQAEKIRIEQQQNLEIRYAHPAWWIDAIRQAWPTQWQDILTANNAHPPFALRVNQRHMDREAYLSELQKNNLSAAIIPETTHGIIVKTPISVDALPGWVSGEISVQDGAAQLAASLLRLAPKQRVLDACAAPGGKLTHLLESEPALSEVIAIDKDKNRLSMVKENLSRLALQATCICHDVGDVTAWWDGQPFDRILLDVPCSASGVIRRHPDIKLLRQSSDITVLSGKQLALLEAVWPLLKPGGYLLYITCSIFPEENTGVLQTFFSSHADAKEDIITASWGIPCPIGRQILPGMHEMDGFYYARISRTT